MIHLRINLFILVNNQVSTSLRMIMEKDFRSTGKCHFTTAKETFWPLPAFVAVTKTSPYTEYFSRG
jgi:hypothetical protein